ncbi:MAG TPA: hypothetical protein VJ650_17685 [Gemmatimonadaceae bacterium]|nr:hypothetical protein [Gemmatimonadaceae bacterium]
MDVWIISAIAMLVVWGIGTFAFEGPGWIHLLLTLGLSVLIWRIVIRPSPDERARHERR